MSRRIAVCVSGLPRFCKETTDQIRYIFNEFRDDRVDWFFHLWNLTETHKEKFIHPSWVNVNSDTALKKIGSKLPTNHFLYTPYLDIYNGEYQDATLIENPTAPPLWLSVHRADLLRQQREMVESFTYDLVIRTRLDIVPKGRLNREIAPNTIVVPGIRFWGPPGRPSDIEDYFAMGSSEDMAVYSCLIEKVQSYRPLFINPPMVSEVLLAAHLHVNGITPITFSDFKIDLRPYHYFEDGQFRMDFGVWVD